MQKLLCCIGCLLFAGNVVSQNAPSRYDSYTDEEVARTREAYKNPENLKETLMRILANSPSWDEDVLLFKQKFDVADDTLRTVLLDIYKSVQHLRGVPFQDGEPKEITDDKKRLSRSISWLGYCADESAKELLMDIATNGTEDKWLRSNAIIAYIQRADAQQVRDALARFLIGDMKVNPYITYLYTFGAYDEAESDPQKREAIVASLIVALTREDNKSRFAKMDKELAARSKEYAESSQRLAMVQRMSKLPPSQSRDTDPDLKTALDSFQSLTKLTSVSTNLTELMARDFRKPPEKLAP